jgi:hypothetical protein
VLCAVFFLLIKSTIDPDNAITTAKAIVPTVPNLPSAGTEPACEVAEDEPDAIEVERVMVVAVVLERLFVLPGLTVPVGLAVVLIKIVDAGKLSATVA